jgi:CDGSH-type Zn-finger protein
MNDDSCASRNEARINENGPLVLRGRIRYAAQGGAPPADYTQVALCRCGSSGNKPFCDGSHAKIGFVDAGRCARPPEPASHAADGDVVLNPIANGPLRIDGWFELTAADGQRYLCGEKTWLCRCGASGNKPFCDGTHKKTGFTA